MFGGGSANIAVRPLVNGGRLEAVRQLWVHRGFLNAAARPLCDHLGLVGVWRWFGEYCCATTCLVGAWWVFGGWFGGSGFYRPGGLPRFWLLNAAARPLCDHLGLVGVWRWFGEYCCATTWEVVRQLWVHWGFLNAAARLLCDHMGLPVVWRWLGEYCCATTWDWWVFGGGSANIAVRPLVNGCLEVVLCGWFCRAERAVLDHPVRGCPIFVTGFLNAAARFCCDHFGGCLLVVRCIWVCIGWLRIDRSGAAHFLSVDFETLRPALSATVWWVFAGGSWVCMGWLRIDRSGAALCLSVDFSMMRPALCATTWWLFAGGSVAADS